MAKAIKFNVTFFDGGLPKFEEGKSYPVTDETLHHVACGRAKKIEIKQEEIDLPEPVDTPAAEIEPVADVAPEPAAPEAVVVEPAAA